MAIPMMAIYVKNYIQGEFIEIREFNLVIIFMIFPEKWKFRLKNKNVKISRKST